MGRKLLNLLGSLKLACVLLAAVAVILAVATFYESSTSSRSALLNVYRTWWFNGLLVVLAINVAAATFVRWPWKRRNVGFVVTHAGIIVLLGGCSAAFHYGTEGIIELRVGEPPGKQVRLADEALSVVVPQNNLRVSVPLHFQQTGGVEPRQFRLADQFWLTLDEYTGNSRVEQTVASGGLIPNLAVRFTLTSEMAQQHVTEWLIANSANQNQISLGPANLRLVALADMEQTRQFTNVVAGAAAPQLIIKVAGQTFTLVATAAGKEIPLGETGIMAVPGGYWPDFRLDEHNKPNSVSDQPNNPAAVVTLRQQDKKQRIFVFAKAGFQPVVTGDALDAQIELTGASAMRGDGVALGVAPDGRVFYAAQSKAGFMAGLAETGKAFAPGWMDFQVTVNEVITNAVVTEQIVPAAETGETTMPALRVAMHAGKESQSIWLRFGQPGILQIGERVVHCLLDSAVMELPFTVALEKFEVQYDEGSDNVAGWTSHLLFEDATGKQERALVWMNHPAWFNGYKFSQSSWNPNDLNYTALQVKKDPLFVTWLTWLGSGLIILGTALLFYFRRWFVNKNPAVNT